MKSGEILLYFCASALLKLSFSMSVLRFKVNLCRSLF